MLEFDVKREALVTSPGERVRFFRAGKPASYVSVMNALATSVGVRRCLLDLLALAPFEAFFWEVVPVCLRSRERPFEFVVLPAPALVGVSPEPQVFAELFQLDTSVVSFRNLSKDAQLIAPCPRAAATVYPHVATFVRQAPLDQRHELFARIGTVVSESLSEHPLWLSTSGLGVYWVHVRLDSRPKYYQFPEYRRHSYPGEQ